MTSKDIKGKDITTFRGTKRGSLNSTKTRNRGYEEFLVKASIAMLSKVFN
jgi:hypothetical protein